MVRLLWLSADFTDPEEALPALQGMRPAPEPIPFRDATVELIRRRLVDAVLVDARQNGEAASALVRKLRSEVDAPIIAVIHDHELSEFDMSGVADFLLHGCSKAELNVRINRTTGASEPEPSDLIRRGAITINRERFEVRVSGEVLDLTFKEFELLAYLAARPGKVCSRNALLSEVWGYDFFGGTRTVDVHVRRLRAKLGQEAHVIETVRNVGYRFAG